MTIVVYQDRSYERHDDESVLQCLLRNGISAPYSCESGVCQACMMRAVEGTPPAVSQQELKATQKELGYFLACVCKPDEDLEVALLDEAQNHHFRMAVSEKCFLNGEILRLRLRSEEPFDYRAGQFINIFRDDLIRSYSLASLPGSDDLLELHVKRVPGGEMSNWLCDEVDLGDTLTVTGPNGECFYHEIGSDGILAVGTGSGLAPLWGIARDVLASGYDRPVILCHGGVQPENLYYVDELRRLAAEHSNFSYYPCVSERSEEEVPEGFSAGFPNDVAFARQSQLANWQVFLCGHPDMVSNTKRKAFLSGASLKNIHADPFVLASHR